MKKACWFLLLMSLVTQIEGQNIHIPDTNFLQALISIHVDQNNDGIIQKSEAMARTNVSVSNRNIQSLEGIEEFELLEVLNCDRNQLSILDVSALANLFYLKCASNQISILSLPESGRLSQLYCQNNELEEIALTQQSALVELDCGENHLTELNLPKYGVLRSVVSDKNQIQSITFINESGVVELDCSGNQLTSFDAQSFDFLRILNINENHFSELSCTQFPHLYELKCNRNQLIDIDLAGCDSLRILYCGDNSLSELELSNQPLLTDLYCALNNIDEIDLSLLTDLKYLHCSNNEISQLNFSNNRGLKELVCSSNPLTDLRVSGLSLAGLVCTNTNLEFLDLSHTAIGSFLDCSSNKLTSLILCPNKPQYEWIFRDNDDLEYVCVRELFEAEIRSKVRGYGYEDCFVTTYCPFNEQDGRHNVNGNVRIDLDQNGCDSSDASFPFLKFNILKNGSLDQFFSSSFGKYNIHVDNGAYTIWPSNDKLESFTIIPDSFEFDLHDPDGEILEQDFCLTPMGVTHDVGVHLLPTTVGRPGFISEYQINLTSYGTVQTSGELLLEFDDNVLDFLGSSLFPDHVEFGFLSWNIGDIRPFETKNIQLEFRANTPTDSVPLNNGDVVRFQVTATIDNQDEHIEDNEFILRQGFVNSFDPNDKNCLQYDYLHIDKVGDYVDYVIRFENTGSATAKNIAVLDRLDNSKFDLSSFQLTSTSHPVEVHVSVNNEVEFLFENINLPFDDDNNDGFVAFKIKTLPNLTIDDTLSNDAEIYFDFNFPIITEPAKTIISEPVGVELVVPSDDDILVYPNPADDDLYIESKVGINEILLLTSDGRSIGTWNLIGMKNEMKIDLDDLASGIYILKVSTKKGESLKQISVGKSN